MILTIIITFATTEFLTYLLMIRGKRKNTAFISEIESILSNPQLNDKHIDFAKEKCRNTPGLLAAAIYITIDKLTSQERTIK